MKYSENSLVSWTAPLSASEAERAENAISMIKSALNSNYELSQMNYEVFAQGSYANNTNVRTDSDVDICIMLKSTFFYDVPNGMVAHDFGITPGTITYQRYRELIKKALTDKFGIDYVSDGNKSLKVKENSYHVKADVVPAFQYRKYNNGGSYAEGIRFLAKDGTTVTNFPKQHIENGTNKNTRTKHSYKKLVRIMKRIKNNMMEDKKIDGDVVTSFLVECLVWNVPDNIIDGYDTWTETVKQSISFLYNAINKNRHKEWGEVSEKLYLFHSGRKWTPEDAKKWLIDAWNYMGYGE